MLLRVNTAHFRGFRLSDGESKQHGCDMVHENALLFAPSIRSLQHGA